MLREIETLPDAFARDVIAHLCGDTCHGVGQTVELCESRGDCVIVVNCSGCGKIFTLDDEQYEALVAWSEAHGSALACGIAPLAM
jgi:hypothetical protein